MTTHAHRGKRRLDALPMESLEVRVLVDNVTDQLSTSPNTVHSELNCLLEVGMSE